MWGAIAGDIIGSTHEFADTPTKTADFSPLFATDAEVTDDTILTVATAETLINHGGSADASDYGAAYHRWGRRYPSSYGGGFVTWLMSNDPQPYNSYGNGSAMRVGPVGWAFETLEETLDQARLTALPTHDHPEGVKGAQAIAHAIFIARNGADKSTIRDAIVSEYGYDLSRTIDQIRPTYGFDETCPGTVPEAVTAFLESEDIETAIRLAISLGGDADTLACIAGSIAHAYYGELPQEILMQVKSKMPEPMLEVTERFCEMFDIV